MRQALCQEVLHRYGEHLILMLYMNQHGLVPYPLTLYIDATVVSTYYQQDSMQSKVPSNSTGQKMLVYSTSCISSIAFKSSVEKSPMWTTLLY